MHNKLELNVTLLIDNSRSISPSGRASIAEVVRSLCSFLIEEKSNHQEQLEIYISECMFSNAAKWNAEIKPVEIYSYAVPFESSGASNIGAAFKELSDSVEKYKLDTNIVILIGDGMITDNPDDRLRVLHMQPAANKWLILAYVIGELEKQYANQYAGITKNTDHVFGIHEQDLCQRVIRNYIKNLLANHESPTIQKSTESEQMIVDQTVKHPETTTSQIKDSWD